MPVLLNKSSGAIYCYLGKKFFNFSPGSLISVSSKEFLELKKIPLISESLDDDVIVEGAEARKIARGVRKEIEVLDEEDKKDKEGKE